MEINAAYKEFNKILYHYILRRVNSKEDAKDILQNVFIKIYQKASSLSDEQKMKSWVYRITQHAIIDYYRTRTDTPYAELPEQLSESIAAQPDTDNFYGLDQCIRPFIEQLPQEYREIVRESELNGIKQKDLAEKYNMPYVSLRSRVQRGREKLKNMLIQCCSLELDSKGNLLEINRQKPCGMGNSPSATCSRWDSI
jgi:RNA polymerase sigma-70 factor, ECF subfamily